MNHCILTLFSKKNSEINAFQNQAILAPSVSRDISNVGVIISVYLVNAIALVIIIIAIALIIIVN
jgi:hypothetical protein